jgi:hypothetical protein
MPANSVHARAMPSSTVSTGEAPSFESAHKRAGSPLTNTTIIGGTLRAG